MDGLSPETRALLNRASEGDRLDDARRDALRRRAAAALGVATPAIPRGAASTHGITTWVLGAFGALGAATTAVVVAVHLRGPAAPAPVAARGEASSAATSLVVGGPPAVDAPAASAAASSSTSSPALRASPSGGASRSRDALTGHTGPAEDALGVETRLVASAQSSLNHGQGARALVWLDEHNRRFPDGALTPESESLRIDALCAVGRAPEARAEALRWATRHPGSASPRLPASCTHYAE